MVADSTVEYTPSELMVAAAAGEIADGETVFVGMRLPMLAFQLAVTTHAPNAVALYESGVVRNDPAGQFIHTMCDLANLDGAIATTTMLDVMGRLQRGDVELGFLGTAEIDRYGTLNTTMVGSVDNPVRLPGSGGACDISCLAGRTVVLMPHEPRRFVDEVTYATSPGHRSDGEARTAPGGGPDALVTSKATFRFDTHGELYLATTHPGVEADDVADDLPWSLRRRPEVTGEPVGTTPVPDTDVLERIRTFDPDGFWTG